MSGITYTEVRATVPDGIKDDMSAQAKREGKSLSRYACELLKRSHRLSSIAQRRGVTVIFLLNEVIAAGLAKIGEKEAPP